MSTNNANDKTASMEAIESINAVDGFDPAPFAVDYTDLNSSETRKRLPVIIQMAWFRIKYPEGKIAVTVEPGKDCYVATARVYPSYKDSPDCFLAEATASRGYCADKPSVSPREWAQTAAIGIALRNAGFGLQFGMAGEESMDDTIGELMSAVQTEAEVEPQADAKSATAPKKETEASELTLEQQYENAAKVPCPIKKFTGKTLGEVLTLDPGALKWLATKYTNDPKVQKAAQVICEYAVAQAS